MNSFFARKWALPGLLLSFAVLAGCGGGSSTSTAGNNTVTQPSNTTQNVLAVTVNAGPGGAYGANGAFASVTICVPGTNSCQTIDNMLVDTGSMGVRVEASVLTLALPQIKDTGGNAIVECNQFVDGFTWGPMRTADVQIAGEKATSVPVQVIGDAAFPEANVPNTCTSSGPSEDTVQTLGANGVLGIGPFRQDCGSACTALNNANPGLYYTCPTAATCQQTAITLAQEAQNPVWMFSTDNNGSIMELPSVSASGQPSVAGSVVFGIGTQSDNALGSATVLILDGNGNFTTSYQNVSYPNSFLDTGSNAIFFLDNATTGLPTCPVNGPTFYCPASTANLSATNIGLNNASISTNFQIANADTLFNNLSNNAFNNVGGPNTGAFDWGLPFFFGRNVFTAVEGQNTPAGIGPYFAY